MALAIVEQEKALNINTRNLNKVCLKIMRILYRESQEITNNDLYSIFSSGIRLNNEKVLLSLRMESERNDISNNVLLREVLVF
nr:phloem protein 2-like protein [Tanacetum cinerariifolium]